MRIEYILKEVFLFFLGWLQNFRSEYLLGCFLFCFFVGGQLVIKGSSCCD